MLIDFQMDETSFKMVFEEITKDDIIIDSENEILIKNYKFVTEKYLRTSEFIPDLLLKLQNIIKIRVADETIKFEKFCRKSRNTVFKVQVENELKQFDFWMINYENNFKWKIDYYSLQRVESKLPFN